MTKAALYARYSSDKQREASIEDQIRLCEERAAREGWTVHKSYTDQALSGASLMRPGIQALLTDAQDGQFDVILAESLDRISRDQEDIAGVYKRLRFAGVAIETLSEGEISELHIGFKGTMGALYLKDLADKTRRGLRGCVEAGRSGGGNSYGYDVVIKFTETGAPDRGGRAINEGQATIVRRIFNDYATGKSPKAIAKALNKEGVPGPTGNGWAQSTINGNYRRGTGILNNELYIGRLVWNRQRFIKDPDTGKRVSRPNPESEWIIRDVPELRIVDQELWEKVKARQQSLRKERPAFWQKQRPRNLFSYLLKCHACGGGFSKISETHYGCSNARNKGTCENRRAIKQDTLENAVLGALQNELMDPALCKIFCEEYTRHLNRLRNEKNANLSQARHELAKAERERERLIQAIKDGIPAAELKDDLARNTKLREKLIAERDGTKEEPVLLHPNMAGFYRKQVENLRKALSDDHHRAEAADLLRALIDHIELRPAGNKLEIDLYGDLAGIISLAQNKNGPPDQDDPSIQQVKLVAGAGFEPATFRL